MKLRNISIVLILVLLSGGVLATDFTIYNKSSVKNVGYILMHGGNNNPGWQYVRQGESKWDTSKLSQLLSIWLFYMESNSPGGRTYYFKDVKDLNIPIVKIGVPIIIGDKGALIINGKQIQAQEVKDPGFQTYKKLF
jgi:hypothetical protein